MGASGLHRVRYYIDEHIDPDVLSYLRTRGIATLSAYDAGRANQQIPDAEQLAYATDQGYVSRVCAGLPRQTLLNPHIVPHIATGQHAGIVSLRREVHIGDQARYLRFLAETETMGALAGQICIYEPIPHGLFPDD